MTSKRDVWNYRDDLKSRMGKMEAHTENIYHHIKRVDTHLERQNGRIRETEGTINSNGNAIGD